MILNELMLPIVADGSVKRAAVFGVPVDFDTNPAPCKLIIYNHGSGQAGDGTINTVKELYANGSPLWQIQQGALTSIVCPVTGNPLRFAILALQGVNGWNVSANDTVTAINLLVKKYSQLSPTDMFVTGLSSGGETDFEMVAGAYANMFAAAFPLSCAPSVSDSVVNWPGINAKVWAMHGDSDVFSKTGNPLTDNSNSVKAVNTINGVKKGFAYYATYTGNHCCWAPLFAPTFRKVLPINASGTPILKAISPYEFWAACLNATISFTASGTDAGIGGTTPNTVTTKAIFTATVSGNTITLDGSASTGTLGSYAWILSGPTKPAWPNGMNSGSGQPGITVLNNMSNGTYTVSLQVFDKAGGKDISAAQTITVGVVVTPPVTPPPAILAIIYNNKTGDKLTVTDDNKLQVN